MDPLQRQNTKTQPEGWDQPKQRKPEVPQDVIEIPPETTNEWAPEDDIAELKAIRRAQAEINGRIEAIVDRRPEWGGEAQLAKRSGQQVRHWCGEALGVMRDCGMGEPSPYPQSDNPDSAVIEPPADV